MVSGGRNLSTLPNVPAVSGSWMIGRDLLSARDAATIERLSREAIGGAGA